MMNFKVKFVDPAKNYQMIREELDAAYFEVMSKGDLIDRGQLKQFEENLAAFVGVKYAVGVNSGYDALHVSLRAAGIGPGDEVIVPSHTFVASASAIVNTGATPVLVDVGADFNIDVEKIETAVTKKTRGIMPVHLNGYMADMAGVISIAEKYRLIVIEDACQSLGASMLDEKTEIRGQNPEVRIQKSAKDRRSTTDNQPKAESRKLKAGAWGLTGCWSFYPFKILGGYGDGGAITTNDPEIALFARRMRYNGEDRSTGEYHGHGFTCLLDNLQAAFLDIKLRHLPAWIVRRKEIASRYGEALSGIPGLKLPHYTDPRRDHVYQNYVVRSEQGNDFSEYLKESGVEVLTQFRKPYYRHEALKLEDRGFPETEALSREVCSLPMNVEITDEDVDYVIDVIRGFYNR